MKSAFIYQDEKSNKFWTIDYEGLDLCVHYGKTGAIGSYEIKEFESKEKCEKEALKLINSKKKKGYLEDTNFDFNACIYMDHEDFGPHPKTSHPAFRAHFIEDFYYDCGDEESPFGSDEGSDTLHEIQEQLRKKPALDFATFPKLLIEKIWDMAYIPVTSLEPGAIDALRQSSERDMEQSDMVTYATAFAQIKTTGKLNAQLKQCALDALTRFASLYGDGQLTEEQQKMYADLESFQCS